MRANDDERKEWDEGVKLLAAQTGLHVTVSDFLRLAAREKLEALRRAAGKKGGR
jgi:hypothetical protein